MANSWQGKIALITGASSGIGAATARRLAAERLTVVLCARRRERLEALAAEIHEGNGKAYIYPADLAQEGERAALFRQVTIELGLPDVLINNAGFAYYGYTDEMTWETARGLLEVNNAAAVHLIRLALPGMIARHSGHIINIGSISGLMPSQGNTLYAATKAFMMAFTTGLHRELGGSGVRASIVHPGPVRTELFDVTERQENGQRLPAEHMAIPPEQVAGAIWSLLRWPRRYVIVPWYWGWVGIVEALFGWLMDRLGPIILRKRW